MEKPRPYLDPSEDMVRDNIDMTAAIHKFLEPIYEQYGKDKYDNLKDFVDVGFFKQGGEINIRFPKWLEWLMGIGRDTEVPDPVIQFTGIDEE